MIQKYDIDKFLNQLGEPFGSYQLSIYVWVSVVWIMPVWHMFIQAFQGATPPFQCVLLDNTTIAHVISIEEKQCSIDVNISNSWNETTLLTLQCGQNRTEIQYDETFGTTIVSEWNFVCDPGKEILASTAGSIYMGGVMVGAFLIPPFADHFGRRLVLLISLALFIPPAIGTAFVKNFVSYTVLRFFCGLLASGAQVTSWVIACEIFPSNMRSYVGALSGIVWVGGFLILGILAFFIRNWRSLQLATSIPMLLLLLCFWTVPESLHWLNSTDQFTKTSSEIKKAAKKNNKIISLQDFHLTPSPSEASLVSRVSEDSSSVVTRLKSIITTPLLLFHSTIMCGLWATNSLIYYGLSLFSTEYTSNRYLSFCLSGVVELPAYVIVTVSMSKFGRRSTIILCNAVVGFSLLIMTVIPQTTRSGIDLFPLIQTLGLIGKFAVSASFMGTFLYAAEIYPTTLRSLGCGICVLSARLAGMLAPYVSLVASFDQNLPPRIFAFLALITATTVAFLPETNNTTLPNDTSEIHGHPVLKKIQTFVKSAWSTEECATDDVKEPLSINGELRDSNAETVGITELA